MLEEESGQLSHWMGTRRGIHAHRRLLGVGSQLGQAGGGGGGGTGPL